MEIYKWSLYKWSLYTWSLYTGSLLPPQKLYKESKWSRTLFGYQYLAFRFMADEEAEDLEQMAQAVPKYQLRIGMWSSTWSTICVFFQPRTFPPRTFPPHTFQPHTLQPSHPPQAESTCTSRSLRSGKRGVI